MATTADETAAAATEAKDNLFPKITGKHNGFLAQLSRLKEGGSLPETIDLEGTVKLHGMHADVVYDLNTSETVERPLQGVTFQSRNKICMSNENQQGWPQDITRCPDALQYLKEQVLKTFEEHNPDVIIDKRFPLIVAGEWVGGNVQRTVGLAQLSTRFVILSVQINGIWQRDVDYRDIRAENAGIYNIFACGSQVVNFDTSDLTDNNPALLELQRLADLVEASCPFAAKFGVPNSRGEGIVWKPGTAEGRADARCWLKTKGPISGKENRIDPARIAQDQAKNLTIAEAVQRWVTPRRKEQGFEYLLEMNMDPVAASLKQYIIWITHDVLSEEKTEIGTLSKRFPDAEKTIKTLIARKARDSYLSEMKKSGLRLA